jgi:hypothetical protein
MLKTLVCLAVSFLVTAAAYGGQTVTGTIKFEGKVPTLRILTMDADPVCEMKHTEPVRSEALVLGEGNALANVFVRVVSGLTKKVYPVPEEPVVLDQNGCVYIPHVLGIRVNQELKILNSDGMLHNIHPLPKINDEFNMAMPKFRKEAIRKFDKEEFIITVKCDVHPWMQCYVGVLSHPFFSVSGTDGKFAISGLDPGTYEIEAWHERLGTQKATVVVAADEAKTVDFTFTR